MTDFEINKFLSELANFHGTNLYYRFMGIMLTDGVKYLCETAGCWWLADVIASHQFNPKVKNEGFQVYSLKVNQDKSAIITIDDGNGNILDTQPFSFTDFPLDTITIWCVDKIALLPSEY